MTCVENNGLWHTARRGQKLMTHRFLGWSPSGLPYKLFATGLGLMAWLAWRKQRNALAESR